MRPLIALLSLLGLAACGAAGAPERPGMPEGGGVDVSGTASIGVVGSF